MKISTINMEDNNIDKNLINSHGINKHTINGYLCSKLNFLAKRFVSKI